MAKFKPSQKILWVSLRRAHDRLSLRPYDRRSGVGNGASSSCSSTTR
ncbi:MAG: hypothetical protein JO297_08040 [Nitrososphaeraceae archaeon]|nr:hypothetical protein [Nitrososphaeraceae archaeon]